MNQNHVSTQCNMQLLSLRKTSSRGITVKPSVKNVSTQFTTGPTPQSSQAHQENIQRGDISRSVSEKQQRIKSTQTVKVSSVSRGTQCGDSLAHVKYTCLEQAIYVLESTPELWILSHEVKVDAIGEDLLIISRQDLLGVYGYGLEPIRITLDSNGVCTVNKMFVPPEVHTISKNRNDLEIGRFMDILIPLCSNDLSLCPGISGNLVAHISSTTKVILTTLPFARYQSVKCKLWHSKNIGKREMCIQCKYLAKSISRARRTKSLETPTRKFKRISVTSNYSIKRLTPMSKRIRMLRLKKLRLNTKAKLTKLETLLKSKDLNLNAEQSLEMTNLVQEINANHQDGLNDVINSTTVDQNKEILKAAWKKDSDARQKVDETTFFKDQNVAKLSDRRNRWSAVTYRIALAIYCRSPAAYNALKSFEILKLPSVRSLQGKTSKFLDSPGINHEYMKEQCELYEKFKVEKSDKGEKVPFGEGVLIFDEVKVIDKIMWNSKNHEFIGLAMTPEDFPYLNDIFTPDRSDGGTTTDMEPKAAKYILQFVWRDLASNFDVIGPYFSGLSTLEHKFILGCVFETMRVFHAYGFKVKCLVCDGASENLAVIKSTMQHKGVFGYRTNDDEAFDFSVKPSFPNPFLPDFKCHWIICPSHQLKNMISALHSSRDGGTKRFHQNGQSVSWEQIINVKLRDDERFKSGQVRVVPGLLEAYIVRDSWTKLNVKPSKIMQQEPVLSELYTHSQTGLPDSVTALETYKYLRACNQIFENGLLSKNKVDSLLSKPMQSILDGFQYFEDWIRDILSSDPEYNFNTPKQTRFLAWQTWDLLRICVFGVQGLVEDYMQEHEDYFIILSRINGSVVESLFSQFKYATGSKLSSVNYAQARKSVMMKSNVHGSHSSNIDYRNVPLYIREHDL